MSLMYLPYVPSLHEDMILRGRRILADQMEFLQLHLPKTSRLYPQPRNCHPKRLRRSPSKGAPPADRRSRIRGDRLVAAVRCVVRVPLRRHG